MQNTEFPWIQPYHDTPIAEAQYADLLAAASCTNLACLRALPSDELANASQAAYQTGYAAERYGYGDFYFSPIVDGHVIKALLSQEFKDGHFTRVPLLRDHNPYKDQSGSGTAVAGHQQELLQEALQSLSSLAVFTQSYYRIPSYFTPNKSSIPEARSFPQKRNMGDYVIKCPAYHYATLLSEQGIPVYKMSFVAGTQLHGATTPYLISASDASGNGGAALAS
ncbi:hypothetical protein BJX65DRAFT_308715 [Aspergillus insuetus]